MSRVSALDGSGALVLRDAIERLEHRGITVYLSGIRPNHHRTLSALGILDRLAATDRVFPNTPKAIAAARGLLHRAGVLPEQPATEPLPRSGTHSG